MKFAVIEYSSKTGQVWRHTPERPNYLADPQKELDPTSFACYVSALEGEHIPIPFLVHPTITKRLYRKFVGAWPKYDISYLKQFDVLMIVHQISDGHEVTTLTKRIRKELPHIKVLGVPTQPYGILKDHWENDPEWLADFKEFMNTCHLLLTIVKETKPVWEAMTDTHVEYLPQPYPVEFASKFFKTRSEKKKIILAAGRVERDSISKGFEAAAALQKKFPDYMIHITEDEPGVAIDTSKLGTARFEIHPFLPWQQQLTYLSELALVINTDYTLTRGRLQMDCAAVGTPSIGANSDAQVDLFPGLAASRQQSIEELVTQGARLLQDNEFYEDCARNALQRMDAYSYDKSAQRVAELAQNL